MIEVLQGKTADFNMKEHVPKNNRRPTESPMRRKSQDDGKRRGRWGTTIQPVEIYSRMTNLCVLRTPSAHIEKRYTPEASSPP